MKQSTAIMILGIFTFILSGFIGLAGQSIETITAPCVDGDGDINLEGFMCEKEIVLFFGEEDSLSGYLISAFILIGVIIFLGGVWDSILE